MSTIGIPRLVTFGGLTIENCTGLGAFNARSRLAILAVIAAAGERGIRRDKLIALFWPDADEERGRNALRQSLFALRQRLGGEPLTLGVSELRLNPAALSSDVSDFETAVSGGRFEDAVALYRGAFLDGVHVRDAADLDQWASEQRQRLAAEYGRALETLAARATRQADRARAAEWWRRRVAHDPLSGRVTLGYLSALAAVGDSEAAIRYASTYARRVQQELDAPPDADVMAFAESLRAAPRVSRAPLGAAPAATGATALPERREVSARAPHARRALFVSIAVIAAIFLGGALWHTQTSEGDSTGVVRFALSFSPGAPLANGVGASFAMSPDGRAVVYRGLSGARLVLYVRPLDELRARVLPGTDDGDQPRFSPDGRWVAFIAENHLKKVRIDGSDAVELAPLTNVRGLSWGPKGFIVASADGRLVSVPESGGVPRVLSALDSARGEKAQLWPLVTDDGGTVLYTSWMGSVRDARLGVLSTTSRTARTLDVGGLYPLQVIDGQLVFAGAENELLTSPVAPGGSQPIRAPTRVLSGIEVGPSGGAKAALSRTGALVYLMQPATQLTSVGADGDSHVIIGEPGQYQFPRISPDGGRIALAVGAWPATEIWIYDVASRAMTRLTDDGSNECPEWSPDGSRVMYRHETRTSSELWWREVNGDTPAKRISPLGANAREGVIAPTGKSLVYRSVDPRTGDDLWITALGSADSAPRPLVVTQYSERLPRISPDGRWLAFESNESGTFEVYVRALRGDTRTYRLSEHGGQQPLWAADGKRVFYGSGGHLESVRFAMSPGFSVTERRIVIADGVILINGRHADYDVARDGTHFLLGAPKGADSLIVVPGWRAELRELTARKQGPTTP